MKPLITVTLMSRDAMDPSTLTPVGVITFESPGIATIILSRDEMGAIRLDATPELKPDQVYLETLSEGTKTLSELHAKIGEMHIATNHALTDMFAIHKLLTG